MFLNVFEVVIILPTQLKMLNQILIKIIAKSTTYVQACYVHNESLAGDKLSISIKGVGLNISGRNTTYYAKGINIYV